MIVYIYGLVDPIIEEVRYIGQSSRLEARYKDHCSTKDNIHSARWIRKLRSNNMLPELIILDVVSEMYADIAEIVWIRYGKSEGWPLTNSTVGGNGIRGLIRTKEHNKKISLSHMGMKHSEESRAKLREAWKHRKPVSEETRKKLSIANSGENNRMYGVHLTGSLNPFFGKHHTEETKKKMRKPHKKKNNP